MSKPWIFICPSSRGIGHAVTRHLLRTTTLPILATSRTDPAGTKSALLSGAHLHPGRSNSNSEDAGLTVLPLDVTSESSIRSAAVQASDLFPRATHHLHLGIAAPGILHAEKSPAQVDYEDMLATFRVNALGPMMLMKHFGEFLPRKGTQIREGDLRPSSSSDSASSDDKSESTSREAAENKGSSSSEKQHTPTYPPLLLPPHATFLTLTARVGSISDNQLGGWYSYRSSKAAANQLARTFDLHLRQQSRCGDKAISLAYHPGTVRTDFTREYWGNVKEDKLLSPEYAAERLCEVVCSRTTEQRGRCWDWEGKEVLP